MGRERTTRRSAELNRGAIYEVPVPDGRRPGVVVTREVAIPVLANLTLAMVTTKARGLPTEVPVGAEHGLHDESVVNCDNLFTVPKRVFGRRLGELDLAATRRLDEALRIALGLD